MNTNWFWKYTLLGMFSFLIAAANLAVADTYNFGTANVTRVDGTHSSLGGLIDAGVILNGDAYVGYFNGTTWGPFTPGTSPHTYNLTGATITINNVNGGNNRAVAVITNDAAGTFRLGTGTLTIKGSATIDISGFVYADGRTNPADPAVPFAGTITGGKSITVNNSVGGAYGVAFVDPNNTTHGAADIDNGKKEITFGDLNITGFNLATGFGAGASDAVITLGTVKATATNTADDPVNQRGLGSGVTFKGDVSGSLTVNAIKAAGHSAFGIQIGHAEADGTILAYGDLLQGSSITVKDGIKTTATGGEAYGIQIIGVTDGKIDVKGITATATHAAVGFGTIGIAEHAVIKLGDVTATSEEGPAFGVGSRSGSAGKITLGDVNVTSKSGAEDAAGLRFGETHLDMDGAVTGTLNTGTITVEHKGTGKALGIHVVKASTTNPTGGLNTTGTLGEITATANTGEAFGIWVDGELNLTLSNDITAASATNNAYGIVVQSNENAVITIANGKSINISATGGEDKDSFGVRAGGNFIVKGNGHADLGAVWVDNGSGGGSLIIGDGTNNTTVAIDFAKSSFGDDTENTVNANATLEVYGDTLDETISAKFDGLGAFKNTAQFTNWVRDSAGIISHGGIRTQVYMNDGYLAAFGMHDRYAVWKAVNDHMISGSGYSGRQHNNSFGDGYYGQAPCDPCGPCDPCDPICEPCAPLADRSKNRFDKNLAWGNYIVRSDGYRSSFNNSDWRLSMNGVQVGSDLFRTQRTQLGFLFGYETGKNTNVNDRINADDLYVGLYMVRVFRGGADVRAVFGYGWQKYDMNRWSDALYTSSFKGRTMEGNLEFGKRISGGPWSVRPALAVDVLNNDLKGAVETGAGMDAVRYNKTDLTQFFIRAGTDLRYQGAVLTFNSGIYYAYDVNGTKLNTAVSSLDRSYASQLTGTKLGRSLLLFNLSSSCQVTQNFAVIGGYQGEHITDRNGKVASTGYIGGSWRW